MTDPVGNANSTNAESNDYSKLDGYTLRQQVFDLLEKNHELTPKLMCQLLSLSYAEKGQVVANYRSQWRHNYRNRPGLKCLKFHRSRGWLYGFRELQARRGDAVGLGWRLTSARNRMVVWSDGLGRLEWFEKGRINVFVRKPASDARLKQLLANAFMWTGLIGDVHVFEEWAKTYRKKGSHLTVDLGERLPYSRVDFLKESNGVVVKTGDLSHPTSLEIEFCYPDFAEKSELALKQLGQFFREFLGLTNGKGVVDVGKGEDYVS